MTELRSDRKRLDWMDKQASIEYRDINKGSAYAEHYRSWDIQSFAGGDIRKAIDAAIAKTDEIRSASTTLERGDSEALIQELLAALKKAHYELNAIRARDGVPYQAHTIYGSIRSDVDEKYFSDVVDECSAAITKAGGRP